MDQVDFDSVETPSSSSDFFKLGDGESKDVILTTKAIEFPNNFDPAKTRHVCGVYVMDDKGNGKTQILDLKSSILTAIKTFAKKKPSWASLTITISRTGSAKENTKYSLTGMGARSEPLPRYDELGKEAAELIEKVRGQIQAKKS